ncbi:hypothetical protein [Pedobacter sp. N23S346]|uniref:hypothetical protein n=1 Tax=Pedobacter sp. N23S346 TaxID=3402750 RepID=UPI003AD608F7
MKKSLFLLLMFSFLFACKKKTDDTTVTTSLSGKWSTGGYELVLYDAAGQIVSHGIADAIKTYWTFDQSQIKLSYDLKSNVVASGYKVVKTLNNRQLLIENTNIAVQTEWKIESQTDQSMSISSVITDQASLNYGQNKKASRGMKTIYFVLEK